MAARQPRPAPPRRRPYQRDWPRPLPRIPRARRPQAPRAFRPTRQKPRRQRRRQVEPQGPEDRSPHRGCRHGRAAPGDALTRRRQARWLGFATLALCLTILGGVTAVWPPATSAAGNTLAIELDSETAAGVARDGTFTATVVQNAEVATSGAQATLTFDAAVLEITSITRGEAYATAPLFTGAGDGAIDAANESGTLSTVAAAFLPPGSVPAGEADFLVIEFKAIGCGQTELILAEGASGATLLDGRDETYGEPLPVTATGASVTICDTLRIEPAAAGA